MLFLLRVISLAEDDLVLEVGMPTCPHALMPTYPMTYDLVLEVAHMPDDVIPFIICEMKKEKHKR